MHCPFCRSSDTRVIDSRDTENGGAIRRRRECTACAQRFTTFERIEGVPLVVIKRDGTREAFDRAKVVSGEITSTAVGHEVLTRLSALDEVAYVRFASVYREFSDVAEFERAIAELEEGAAGVGGHG
jgi:transcriptional repressor NrdR